ncbi:DNA-binding MarR family transcriptional regulator [Amycolatopsis echigonensis]|uniref:DNA-binding MarR family transcriptional regulator n=1 Tax=Amycolatopsis echigonensis TaxID=2576905 RepID=A0A2N3WML8_9PSEU|nr:MarR family transcriptional regulator [Amycolatopsis niigatensis]PKV95107.1 DNA-binding MarR family transcriptional regulator [Amycolatopsis niigatensis]
MSAPDELAVTLYGAVSLIARRLRQSQVTAELSLPERSALSRLDRDGPATTAALARAEQITPQAMSTTISGLSARGFVARTPDPADGRQMIVSLTPEGSEVLRARRDARMRQFAESLRSGFSPEELAVLKEAAPLLERLGQTF